MNDVSVLLTQLVSLAAFSAAILIAATPAQCEPACDGLKKYVVGKAAIPLMQNRGTRTGPNGWKARTPIAAGDCGITSEQNPHQYVLTCVFDSGAEESVLLAHYQALGADIQSCLGGLDSRFDWRKRDTSRTEADGRTVKETTWIWTMLRDQTERQVRVSSNMGATRPSCNLLIVSWRTIGGN